MSKTIGNAADFYRLRVKRLDLADEPDLEWREDILYREPPHQVVREQETWALEAVSLDNEDHVVMIAAFEDSEAAHDALEEIAEDLSAITKSGFEERYLSPASE